MKRTFCNVCEDEITKDNFSNNATLNVEVDGHTYVLSGPDAVCIDHDVCRYCLLDALVDKFDNRPKNGVTP